MTTYTASVAHFESRDLHACGDCDWQGETGALKPIGDAVLSPGDASPSGRCPVCDTLAYPVEPSAPLDDPRAKGTVLAALRSWQRDLERHGAAWAENDDIASDCGELVPLDASEIDVLCEELNT